MFPDSKPVKWEGHFIDVPPGNYDVVCGRQASDDTLAEYHPTPGGQLEQTQYVNEIALEGSTKKLLLQSPKERPVSQSVA